MQPATPIAPSLAELESRAAGGDAAAKLAYAVGLIAAGQDGAGMRLLHEAAAAGDAEAYRQLSVHRATGADGDAWKDVLADMARAAAAGHILAQQELCVLAGNMALLNDLAAGAAVAADHWHGMGAGLDHAALLQTPAPRQVMKTPHVQTVQNMIPVHVCDWIIARAQERLVRARVFDPVSGEGRSTVMRTNRDTRFQFHELDLVQIMILRRIGAMTGFDFKAMEPTSVLHYQVGEQFRQHFDYLDPGAYADEVKANGQRVGTFLIYLNDNFDGGETFFPITTFKHRGRRGDGLIFRNVTAAGAPDRLTLHAGLAPTRGEKWLFSQWIRERPKKPG